MPAYAYKARDTAGRAVKGTMQADNREDLVTRLHRMGYMTTQVKETLATDVNIDSFFDRFTTVSGDEMILFNIQLSNMVNAGLTLLASLNSLLLQIQNNRLKQVVRDIAMAVEGGDAFSDALARQPKMFARLFISMVRAGEASGKLGPILTRLATYAETSAELKHKVTSAMLYPLILLLSGLGVALFIITNILPQFAEIFLKVGITLPVPTLVLFKFGLWLRAYWYLLILGAAAVLVALSFYVKTPVGRYQLDVVKLNLPMFGTLYRKAAISRFTRTLGMLVESGVPILPALDIVKDVIGNELLSAVIGNVYSAVEKGERISEPLKLSGQFPPDVVQMVAVGEETGNLEAMLTKISDITDLSINYTLKKLTTALEPVLLIFMGGLIGFIMAAMILPIFDMMKILRR